MGTAVKGLNLFELGNVSQAAFQAVGRNAEISIENLLFSIGKI